MKNQKCIVRGDRSGVFYGEVVRNDGREVELSNCRRLWYWNGATECCQLALDGVKEPLKCKFTVSVPSIVILDAIELIPCSASACKSIEAVPVWKM